MTCSIDPSGFASRISASILRACFGIIDSTLLGLNADPIWLNAWRFKALPAASKGRISIIVCDCCTGLAFSGIMLPMKYWEIVAGKLTAAGISWGYCSAVTRDGWRWIVDARDGNGHHYIVHSDELLTAFLELETMLL